MHINLIERSKKKIDSDDEVVEKVVKVELNLEELDKKIAEVVKNSKKKFNYEKLVAHFVKNFSNFDKISFDLALAELESESLVYFENNLYHFWEDYQEKPDKNEKNEYESMEIEVDTKKKIDEPSMEIEDKKETGKSSEKKKEPASMKNNKTEFTPDDFLTRAERVKKKTIPKTSKKMIIVNCNSEALGFKFNCYSNDFFQDKIDKETFDITVKKANKICENAWRQKKMEEEADFNKNLKKILYFAIIISLIAFLLLILLIYGPGGDGLLYASIVLLALASLLTIVVVIKSMFSHPKFMVLEEVIMKNLQSFLDEENVITYRPKQYEWVIGENFYWLELHDLNFKFEKDLDNNNEEIDNLIKENNYDENYLNFDKKNPKED